MLKWLFSKDSCKSALGHLKSNEKIAQILWKGSSRCLLFSKYWLSIHRSIDVIAELYPAAWRPSWQCSGSGPLALLWRSVGSCSWSRPHSPPHRWQVTCGMTWDLAGDMTGDMTGASADNTLVAGDMWPARAQAPDDRVGYPLEVRSGASCLQHTHYTQHSSTLNFLATSQLLNFLKLYLND